MQKKRRWLVHERCGDEDISDLVGTGLSPVICRLLINRGILGQDQAQKFINPQINMLYYPYLLPDMNEAVNKIKHAVDASRKITIYGDYDADGVTSTAVLYRSLKSIGANVDYYIPDRIDEGYGLNIEAIDNIIKSGTDLIVTVDCGVSSINEVKHCKDAGRDIIITDHHECGQTLPDTLVINPKRGDSEYPFSGLAGVGVVFKLVQALSSVYKEINPYQYLDLVAIGTIADIVPAFDENRIIIKHGLDAVKNTSNPGIKALMKAVNLPSGDISSSRIGFIIAPRINAVGRIGSADMGVNLFITDDYGKAEEYAAVLCDCNKKRQEIEEAILLEAEEKIKGCDDFVVVLESEGWHVGVLGIVASRLVEQYYRPVILLNTDGDTCKGSGRSIPGFNLYKALSGCSDLLIKFGGHEQAAGLSISRDNIEDFRARINNIAVDEIQSMNMTPVLDADLIIEPEEIDIKLADEIKLLEPFGIGNPEPVFIYRSTRVLETRTVGAKNNHLKLKLSGNDGILDAIAFNMGGSIEECSKYKYVDVACSIEKNNWNNNENVQLVVRDLRLSFTKTFEREYYRCLKGLFDRIYSEGSMNGDLLSGLDIENKNVMDIMEENRGRESTAVLVSSRYAVEEAVEYRDEYEICMNSSKGGHGRPVLVICPDPQKICYDGIKEIFLLDSIAQYGMIKEVCRNHNIICHICIPCMENDIKFVESIEPARDSMEKVYLYLKKAAGRGTCRLNLEKMSETLSINMLKLYYILKVFRELSIISTAGDDTNLLVKFNVTGKKNLDDSPSIKMFEQLHTRLCFINKIFNDYRGNTDGHKRKNQGN